MKNITKLFAIALVTLGTASTSFAQSVATATASTSAKIIVPISIEKTTDMNFGTVVPSAAAGNVVLGYNDDRTANLGVTLLNSSTAQKTAVFTVSGENNSSFNVTVPTAAIDLTGTGLSSGMTASSFVADCGASTSLSGTTKVIKVKATLNVPANAIAGTYSNASGLFVTVNYN